MAPFIPKITAMRKMELENKEAAKVGRPKKEATTDGNRVKIKVLQLDHELKDLGYKVGDEIDLDISHADVLVAFGYVKTI